MTTAIAEANSVQESGDDKRLERLFDYTKFHIGIYLSAGGALVTSLGLAAQNESFVNRLVGSPLALVLSLLTMAVAGLAGGVIASSATQARTFDDLWRQPQGPYKSKWFSGQTWACIEHLAFWCSLALFAYSVLCAPSVIQWVLS